MNLTWHIIKKDLLRLRLPALLWAAILAGQVYAGNALLSPLSLDLKWFYQMGNFFNLLVFVGLVVTYILVAILILDDPLAGTTMFWVTRPITGGRLLGAKIVVAFLLFGLLPLLVWLPWWLYCSYGWHDLLQAGSYVLAVQAIVVVPAFVLAALVDQLGRLLLFSLLLVFAIFVVMLYQASDTELSHELLMSRLLVAAGLLFVFGLAVVGWQYFTRKLVPAAVGLAAAVLVALTIVLFWPVDLSRFWAEYRAPLAGAGLISGEIHSARMSSFKDHEGVEIDTVIINLRFTGGQDEITLAGGLADVELRWPDGVSIRQERLKITASNEDLDYLYGLSGFYQADIPLRRILGLKADEERWAQHWDPATSAKQAELSEEWRQRMEKRGQHVRVPNGEPGSSTLSVTVTLTLFQAARIKSDPPACSVSARIGAHRPEVLLEMPLKKGAQMARNGERVHILGMGRIQRPESVYPQSDWLTATAVSTMAPAFSNDIYLMRMDRNHGVLRFLTNYGSISAVPMAADIRSLPFGFNPPQLWRENKWVDAPGWEEASTLVTVTYRDAGGFDRDFHTDRLVAKPKADETIK